MRVKGARSGRLPFMPRPFPALGDRAAAYDTVAARFWITSKATSTSASVVSMEPA
jgi:hypothetical protein